MWLFTIQSYGKALGLIPVFGYVDAGFPVPAMAAMLMILVYNLADTFLSGRRMMP